MTTLDRLLLAFRSLGPDEREVLALIAERLVMGRENYGELDVASDRRNMHREAGEELVAATVYLAIEALKARQ